MKKVHGETEHMRIERMSAAVRDVLYPEPDIIKLPQDSSKSEIVPDQNFITQNTADLKALLDSIPEEALNYDEEVFEKDFKEVLNSADVEYDQGDMNSLNCDECKFRATTKRCLKAHVTFVHGTNFFQCQHCQMKTRTEKALFYHIDLKHTEYWELKEEVKEKVEDKNQDTEVKIEAVEVVQEIVLQKEFKCNFCERTFDTDRGRGIHEGRKHKEEYKEIQLEVNVKCNICEWIGSSDEQLEIHKKESHIEQLKRKINQDQPNKCYICGFKSASETAFKSIQKKFIIIFKEQIQLPNHHP